MSTPIQNRYDFVYFFDVTDGNPNGDPDAGNLPRIDPETNQGLVTDVCLKRKIRNFVSETSGQRIYVREKAVLNAAHNEAYLALELKPESKKLPKDESKAKELTDWMCKNFFDIRTFGAVMTTEVNCGQVRGPLQMTFARSIDPVVSAEFAITRCAVTNEKDIEKERTIGRKFNVPYGL
jgi:CRISPR-associated protein Csd2